MRFIEKVALFTFFVMASWTACASPGACKNELRELVVPSFQDVAMNKSDIQAEIEDESNGIYSVRLYVAADSPDNLDKQVSIGWVNLDTNSMKVLDVTRDPDHPDELKVDEEKYRKFVSDCIRASSKTVSMCDDLNNRTSETAVRILHSEGKMTVIGSGRLQFYSAPDLSCKIPGVFILPGESVVAEKSDRGFTFVAYRSAKKDGPVLGWVKSDRVKHNGVGATPRQPANSEQTK
ncbi:hypothetical protein FEP12_03103 [Burkholderia multivorans]|nr:hypothetical protein [Burkholderia multivorans]MDR9176515.1 hypothetical protein [Burkholderia multivorans]MDR9182635.1 hypothetical protein [Burkholderia multivorans]MDR9188226.1 hypothetical protein [Burkholderia multivorans]MDR9192039.1 hypothetical protein [Burkholderia multivorans]